MAKSTAAAWPRTVQFGTGRIRISKRANGGFALAWRELGLTRRTTKSGEQKALAWAGKKARELDASRGEQWVQTGDADALKALRMIAGDGEGALRKLLADVRDALAWLEGAADLTTAARHFAENGPLKVQRTTAAAAIARFLGDYSKAPAATRNTFTVELDGFRKKWPEVMMLDLTPEVVERWCDRRVIKTGTPPAAKTKRNRVTTWVTFLNRARDWGLLGSGKHAADLIRKPTLPDAGKEIFSLAQGARLLAAVREDERLLTYALVAGWIGLRPSEAQRLCWEAFDWERGHLHVSVKVAGKTSSERYVPLDARLLELLRGLFVASGKRATAKVCVFRSREYLSLLARAEGICAVWPADVLRHSFCSYRIAVVKSLDQVADEAGNSPGILKSNYRKPLLTEDGLAWWTLLEGLNSPCGIAAARIDMHKCVIQS